MSKIRLHGSSSGYTEIAPVAASGNNTVTLPSDGTLISHDGNGAVGVTSITVGTGVTAGDGRVTATSFHGSAASLTAIPAANIVGLATAGFSGRITMAQQWRVTADFTIGTGDGDTVVSSNWESADTHLPGSIGSNLSESSGVFTFPSTGIYLISAQTQFNNTSAASYRIQFVIQVYNGSSWETAGLAKHSLSSPAEQSGSMHTEYLFDVTNTSNDKFKLVVRTYQDSIKFHGASDKQETGFNVFRLGDT